MKLNKKSSEPAVRFDLSFVNNFKLPGFKKESLFEFKDILRHSSYQSIINTIREKNAVRNNHPVF